MNKKKFKRSIVLVDKKIQLKVLGYFCFLAILPILISYCTVRIGINQILIQFPSDAYMSHYSFGKFMSNQLFLYSWQTVVLVFFVMGTFVLAGIYLTHRIVGPIYHLRMHMRKIMETGEIRPVNFRKGDYFKELESEFNNFQEFLSKK